MIEAAALLKRNEVCPRIALPNRGSAKPHWSLDVEQYVLYGTSCSCDVPSVDTSNLGNQSRPGAPGICGSLSKCSDAYKAGGQQMEHGAYTCWPVRFSCMPACNVKGFKLSLLHNSMP